MKNILGITTKIFVFTISLYLFSKNIYADNESISRFNTTIKILPDGKIFVKEDITYDFGTNKKHGIFRTTPYKKTNQEGDKFVMTLENISVQDDSGRSYKFTTSKNRTAGEVTLKIGDPDAYVTGQILYEISYTVSGALAYFEDHDELYWNFTGNKWEVPILSSTNLIILPNSVSYKEANSTCFTGYYGSSEKNCQVNIAEKGALINTTGILSSGQGISGVVGFPKGAVAVLEPQPDSSWIIDAVIGLIAFVVFVFWYIYYPIKTLIKRLDNRKYLENNKRIVAAWFDPPKDDKSRKYTPAETGVLIDKTPDHKEVTATIIDLAQKGYMKITKDKDDFVFMKVKDYKKDTFIKVYEKSILDGLFEKKEIINTKDLKTSKSFGKNIAEFLKEVVEELEKKELFEEDLSKEKNMFIGMNIFAGITFNAFYLLVSLLLRHHYIRFSKKGVEKYSETSSLNNFLVSQDEKLDFQAQNMMFFEKLLPYATAFGVENVWAGRFKDLKLTESDWFEGDIRDVAFYAAISNSINRSVQSSMTHYSSGSSSSGFSSGFSGGGFSGGGGGGGGGGSW